MRAPSRRRSSASRCSSCPTATTPPRSSASSARAGRGARRLDPDLRLALRRGRRARGRRSAPALSPPQRLALVRAAVRRDRTCAARALVGAAGLRAGARRPDRRAPGGAGRAGELELAAPRARRRRLRARARRALRRLRRAPRPSRAQRRALALAAAAIAALRSDPTPGATVRSSSTASTTSPATSSSWSARWRDGAEVTVAVTYEDREALAARATLLAQLRDELGADRRAELEPRPRLHRAPQPRAISTRTCSSRSAAPVEPDGGRRRCSSRPASAARPRRSAPRSRACSPTGTTPDEIAIVVRDPAGRGAVARPGARALGDPGRARGRAPLDRTGRRRARWSRSAARSAGDDAGATLLAHLRADPGDARPGSSTGSSATIRRGDATTVDEAIEGWQAAAAPPGRLRAPRGGRRSG